MKALELKGKNELRAACKAFGIKNYGKMTNDMMRAAITQAEQSAAQAEQDASLVKQCGHVNCPKCGQHLSNGFWNSDSLVQSHLHNDDHKSAQECNEQLDAEFWCMACDECFGSPRTPMNLSPKARKQPESEGIKIEKNREERNGIKRPSIGGACRKIWDYCDTYFDAKGVAPKPKECKAFAALNGLNLNNAVIELYQWRKFVGLSKGA